MEKLLGGGSTIGERYEIDAEILAHYEEGIEKERLLGKGVGRLEYVRTRELEQGGRTDPHYSTLSKLAVALGVSVGELLEEGKVLAPQ